MANNALENTQVWIPNKLSQVLEGHIKDGVVTAAKMAADAIVTANLADASVTGPKLAAGAALRPKLGIAVLNETGGSIAADKLVALVGFDVTTGLPNIVLADADVAAHDDVWVTAAAIADGAEGVVYKAALSAATLNTNSATTAGDPVYLSTTAGGFTHTAPTGASARNMPIGWVVVKSATVGQIAWSIGPTRMYGSSELQANSIIGSKLATGVVKTFISDGVNETTPTNIPVTGMAVGDEVVSVVVFTTKASIATMALHAGAFTAAVDGATPGTPADNTGNQYLVTWIDKT